MGMERIEINFSQTLQKTLLNKIVKTDKKSRILNYNMIYLEKIKWCFKGQGQKTPRGRNENDTS